MVAIFNNSEGINEIPILLQLLVNILLFMYIPNYANNQALVFSQDSTTYTPNFQHKSIEWISNSSTSPHGHIITGRKR
jgi:hypothetical protein